MTTAAAETTKYKYFSFCRNDNKFLEKSKTIISNSSHPRVVDDIVLKAAKAEKLQPRYSED
jgi:hypothetical protein